MKKETIAITMKSDNATNLSAQCRKSLAMKASSGSGCSITDEIIVACKLAFNRCVMTAGRLLTSAGAHFPKFVHRRCARFRELRAM